MLFCHPARRGCAWDVWISCCSLGVALDWRLTMKRWKPSLLYLLTLPERLLRAMAAALGGVVFVLADLIVPRFIQRTTIYYLLLGGGMRYAVERLAGIPGEQIGTDALPALPEQYQRRKLVGTAIEAAGLLTFGFSPLWVFAIAGDAAAGSKVFLHRLESHLKEQGAIREDAEIDDLTDLLDALQAAARAMTTVLDTPPLSRKELEQISRRLRHSYSEVFSETRDLAERLDGIWQRMKKLDESRDVDIERLDILMASRVAARLERSRAMVGAMRMTGSELFGEEILEGYRQTLEQAAEWGWGRYLLSAYLPFWQAAHGQFAVDSQTWTGNLLRRRDKG
jgi:hypothetical protein